MHLLAAELSRVRDLWLCVPASRRVCLFQLVTKGFGDVGLPLEAPSPSWTKRPTRLSSFWDDKATDEMYAKPAGQEERAP
jgi:hypothetical protein